VNPAKRPSCDQILSSKLVQVHFQETEPGGNTIDDYGMDNAMLKTIHVPKNLNQLSDLLPKPKYENEQAKPQFERSKSTQRFIERAESR
jgi:hypothetical protein